MLSRIDRLKTLKHILSGLIWSLIALYTLLMTLTHIPAIQTIIASKTATAIGQKLGTNVTVERIDLGFLNRIIIDNVQVFDQQEQKLLRIGRLSVRAEWSALLQGRIAISSAQLFGAHAKLYRANEQAPANFQFIVDALASKDTTSHTPLDLHINSLIIRNSGLSYHQMNAQKVETFSTKHLGISNISAHIILKKLTEDSLNINVKRVALKEQSGLQLSNLSFKLDAGKRTTLLTGLSVQMPHSAVSIDTLTAFYDDKRWKETLNYHLNRLSCHLSLNELACFLPALKHHDDVVDLTTSANGTYSNLRIPWLNIESSTDLITFKGKGWGTNLHEPNATWSAEISKFSLTSRTISILQNEINGIPELVNNIGGIDLNGKFERHADGDVLTACAINTGIGALNLHFRINSSKAYSGHIQTEGINLQKLLDDTHFGDIATTIDISGDSTKLNAVGKVPMFTYNQYTYHNINLNTSFSTDDLIRENVKHFAALGTLNINDEHIKLNAQGEWKRDNKNMTLRIDGNVKDFAPKALNLSDKWNETEFAANFSTDVSYSSLNDAQGTVNLSSFTMKDSTDVFQIDKINLVSGYEEGKHFLHIKGDMGEMELTGQFDWDKLPQSFINAIGSKLPTLPGLPPLNHKITNNFDISLKLVSTEWLQRLAGFPLSLDSELNLQANINDMTHELSIKGSIPAFCYNGAAYKDVYVLLTSPTDSIKCDIELKKVMDDGTNMDLGMKVNASDNQLTTNVSWENHAKGIDYMNGKLNATAQLYTDERGKAEAHIHIQPSHTTLGHATWNIVPSHIFYSEDNLVVEDFSVEHNQQHLTINGTASSSPSDTLTVDLKEMEVGYILDLINFHSVEFDGKATGKAFVTQLFDTPHAWTNLIVEQFRFEGGRMGTLHANAKWNNEEKQIDIAAKADDGPEAQTLINGYVSPSRNDILLNIGGRGTYIDFLQTYTTGVMENVTGHAYGDVRLVGPLGAMDLLGTLVVDGQARVKALGTTYTLKKDTVRLVHDDIQLNNAIVYDRLGNQASISGGIHHENLSKMTFDLNIETPKLLAYEFNDFGEDVFCGSVITSGTVDLHGRPGEVVINCNATPLKPTSFVYNASSAGNVSSQEYITWRDKKELQKSEPSTQEDASPDIPSDLFINFSINATPDATIRLLMDDKTGDYITFNGTGMIRASYHNKGAFQMFGTYRVNSGTYGITIQNIIKKNFQFNEGGTIVFSGVPMEANLNLQAMYTVNGVSLSDLNIGNSFSKNTVRVNCLMNIQGQAGAPRVDFDLDMPTVNSEEKQMIRSVITNEQEMNQQVLYLLGIGRFYTQGVNNSSSQEYDPTGLAMQSFLSGTLSTQINEVISQVIKNENWNFGANISTGNEGWHNAEYEGIISGRMLNNRLLINGQFGYRDNATQATPSFIGDFDIRYLLFPNGNLALKVYNQTNDRYFTRSSLNTQGIGVIMKRDFSNLGDLFFRRKK